MNKIEKNINDLEQENSIEEKIKKIKNINIQLNKEKQKLNKLFENVSNDTLKIKPTNSLLKKTLDELNILFDDSNDIDTKVKIYNAFNTKINNMIDTIIVREEE